MPNSDVCRDIVRQLWPYLDGALPDEWMERVVMHLEGCDMCRSHYDFERSFLEAVHLAKPDEAEFEVVRERVLKALAAEGMLIH